jgi:hypothetical protein
MATRIREHNDMPHLCSCTAVPCVTVVCATCCYQQSDYRWAAATVRILAHVTEPAVGERVCVVLPRTLLNVGGGGHAVAYWLKHYVTSR